MDAPDKLLQTNSASYEQDYSKRINLQMRVPQTITVSGDDVIENYSEYPGEVVKMKVPEKIVISLDEDGNSRATADEMALHQPSAMSLAHADHIETPNSTPIKYKNRVEMATPPRIITVSDVPASTVKPAADDKAMQFIKQIEAENELDVLKRQVLSLARRVHTLEEDYKHAGSLNRWVVCFSLILSIANGLLLMKKQW